jgi:hypothetical protein
LSIKTRAEKLNAAKQDSIDFAEASKALKEKSGQDYEERQEAKFLKEMRGEWLLIIDREETELTFDETKSNFLNKEEDKFPVKWKAKNYFALRNFTEKSLKFERIERGFWMAKQDGQLYELKWQLKGNGKRQR